MAKGYPSMLALLGLVAVAGYQNRDRIADFIGSLDKTKRPGGQPIGQDASDRIGERPSSVGDLLRSGLGELVERFRQNGRGDVAQSWVKDGPNADIEPYDLEAAIGPDVLDELSQRTGLDREEVLARLSRQLPSAVDKYTPDGRLPDG
jgi:uncharacterized protein YidB (DUF937 family)